MDSIENRKFARVSSRTLVRCEKFDPDKCVWFPKVANVTKNISVEGALLESEQPLRVGDVLRLELNLPGWSKHMQSLGLEGQFAAESDTLSLVGTVVRVEGIDGRRSNIGISFAELSKNGRWALMSYIYENPGVAGQ